MRSLSLALPVLSILAGNSSPLLAQLPEARRVNQVDVYHGLEVADPYRWLEAMESSETLDWVRAQDEYARSFAAELSHRNLVREQIEVTAGVNRFRAPVKRGGRYFYIESDGSGLGGFRVMMRDGLRVPARELIGYNAKPGRNVSGFVPDPAGRYVAYGTMMGQSRWERWYVRDVALGSDLADEIRGVNRAVSTVVWAPDGSGFYYGKLEEPDSATMLSASVLPGELYYHRLGSRQIDDTLVFSPESDEWFFTHAVTDDGRFLVVTSRKQSSNNNLVFVKNLTTPRSVFIQLTPEADASYALVGSTESRLLFLTNLDAPNSRVISIDFENPATEEWAEVIPESEDAVDTWIGARAAGDRIVVGYRKDALLVIKLFNLDGSNKLELDLPAVRSVWTGLVGRQWEHEAFYNLSGFADPGSIYRVDLATGESTLFKRPELDYNPDDIVTRQVFFTSADGTRVPMFVAHRRDLPLDGSRPAL
ncbi:MAG: hypothetical protein IH877_10575, partial [Gemmatimonadetes bacterium]|nr:hypothetical protein [Gemmatimonadota bacterium]